MLMFRLPSLMERVSLLSFYASEHRGFNAGVTGKPVECAAGMYFWTSDMIIVEKLTEKTICETVDSLLSRRSVASVFSKDESPPDISP